MRLVHVLILAVLSLGLGFPVESWAMSAHAQPDALENFSDSGPDSTDDEAEENAVDVSDTYYLPYNYAFVPIFSSLPFLESEPTLSSSYIPDFHVPPSR